MTSKPIYHFTSYKTFLGHIEHLRNPYVRGLRTRLAEAAGCNNSFISQVLNTNAHFGLEQAMNIGRYLGLNQDEEHYFILLVEYERAGTKSLKEYFQNQMQVCREKFLNIKDRVKQQTALSLEAQSIYYGHWYYAAIHMIVTIPELREITAIAKALNLKPAVVENVVTFLVSVGLLLQEKDHFLPGPTYIHLENTSPQITKHHTNWRIAAIQSLQSIDGTAIHYSTVSTMSVKDTEILREKLVQQIQDYVQIVSKSSSEETMYGFNLDFFKLIG